jgi:outer membrane protein TolC/outer membrane protein assembly factor BamD (BamD/ComL family)
MKSAVFSILLICVLTIIGTTFLYAQQDPPSSLGTYVIKRENANGLFEEAKRLYRTKDYQAAKEKLEHVLSVDPQHRGAQRYLVTVEKKLQAIEMRERRRREEEELRQRRAAEMRLQELRRQLDRKRQERAALLYRQGRENYASGHHEEAQLKFEKALKIDPTHSGVKKYLQLLARDEAIVKEEVQREVERDRQRAEERAEQYAAEELRSRYRDGVQYYKNGDYEVARFTFEEVLRRDPDHKGAKKYLDRIEEKARKQREKVQREAEWQAARTHKKIERKTPETPEPEVEERLPAATDEQKDEATALYRQGKESYKHGDYETAKQQFEAALKLDPGYRSAKRYLDMAEAKLEAEERRMKRKKEEVEKRQDRELARERAKEAVSLYQKGKEDYRDADYREAKHNFEGVLELVPQHMGAERYIDLIGARIDAMRYPIEASPGPGKIAVDECVRIAIENHLPLRIADEQIKLEKHKALEASRKLFPNITLKYESLEGTEYVAGQKYHGESYAIEGQQSLYSGGESWALLRQAKINLKVAQENKKKIENELVLSVRRAFYSFIKAKETVKQQQELLSEVEKIYNSVTKQHEQGVCSLLEFLNVQAKYNQVYFQHVSAIEDEKIAALILAQAMNIDPQDGLDIVYILEATRSEVSLDDCLGIALTNRAKVRINELVIEFARQGRKIAHAKGLPRVDISGSYGKSGEAFIEDEIAKEKQWYVGGSIKVPFGGSTGEYSYTKEERAPVLSAFQGTEVALNSYKLKLFDNLRYFSDKQRARIEYHEANNQLQKTRKEVTMEVKESFYNYKKALLQMDVSDSKLKFQTKEAEIYKLRRSFGAIPDSEVIESLLKRTQEEFSYVQAVTDYFSAIASLNKAIGIEDHFKP